MVKSTLALTVLFTVSALTMGMSSEFSGRANSYYFNKSETPIQSSHKHHAHKHNSHEKHIVVSFIFM